MATQKLLIIGFGGLGCEAVGELCKRPVASDLEVLLMDSDTETLNRYKDSVDVLQAGVSHMDGKSCGGRSDLGEQALLEVWPALKQKLNDGGYSTVVVLCGLGRGFGSGGVVELCRQLRALKVMSLALVTQPFIFEGNQAVQNSDEAMRQLRQFAGMVMPVSLELIHEETGDQTMGALRQSVVPVLSSGLMAVVDVLKKNKDDVMALDYSAVSRLIRGHEVECGLFYASNDGIDPEKLKVDFFASPLGGGLNFMGQKGNLILKMTASADLSRSQIELMLGAIQGSVPKQVQVLVGLNISGTVPGVRLGGIFVRRKSDPKHSPSGDVMKQPELPLVSHSCGVFTGSSKKYTPDGFDLDQPSFQRKMIKVEKGQLIPRSKD